MVALNYVFFPNRNDITFRDYLDTSKTNKKDCLYKKYV